MKPKVAVWISLLFSCCSLAQSPQDIAEIRMASEAAPDHISAQASFLKFENGEFVRIKTGTNNFTCFVVRDPNQRYEPACLNQEAVRSVLPTYEMQMKLLFGGASYNEALAQIALAYEQGRIPTAETGALVYMMSPRNQIFDAASGKLVPTSIHQMYYYPKLPDETFALENGPPWLWQGFPHMSALIVVVDGQQGE